MTSVLEPTVNNLKRKYGANKVVPPHYEAVVFKALAHYPELKNIRMHFKLKNTYPMPFRTMPSLASLLKIPSKRKYTIVLEKTGPLRIALLGNLPDDAKIGIVGREMAHIARYNSCGMISLLKTMVLGAHPSFRRKRERKADCSAIEHGLRKELYAYAVYIRSIPAYRKKQKKIDKIYMRPEEILEYIPPIRWMALF